MYLAVTGRSHRLLSPNRLFFIVFHFYWKVTKSETTKNTILITFLSMFLYKNKSK